MKKNNLWKAIGISFIVFVILSWIIPTGSFSSGVLTKGTTAPLGILDIFRYPLVTSTTSIFVLTGIVILLIGGFYGVLNKTGAYSKLVENITKKFKGKEKTFLIISIFVLSLLASLTGLTIPLFILVPFFITVILSLGYNKITALLATVGGILVGNLGSTYGFNINGYVSYFLGNGINDTIVSRVILFILLTGLLMLFVSYINKNNTIKPVKKTKKNEVEEIKTDIPLYEKNVDKKKSIVPMVALSVVMMLLIIVGTYNWETGLNIDVFTNMHNSIMNFKLNGYPIFQNLIGSVDPIGYWSNYEVAIILFLTTLLISFIYKVKGKEKWNAFLNGMKEMIPVAIYAVLASILFLLMNNSDNGATLFNTIADYLMHITKGFNIFGFGLISIIGSFFYNDFPYLLNALYDPITTLYTNTGFIGIVMQVMHGLVMLVAPTSVILVAGLRYLNISYTDWLKNIWKYLLIAFLLIAIVLTILLLV